MAIPGLPDWQQQILKGVGAPVTPANLSFVNAWQRGEGGTFTNNPFNTTMKSSFVAPGVSSAGVKNYTTPQAGIQATIDTLKLGYYKDIVAALRKGTDPMAAANALAASPWGTGGLVQKILGSTPNVPSAALPPGSPKGLPPTPTAPPATPALPTPSAGQLTFGDVVTQALSLGVPKTGLEGLIQSTLPKTAPMPGGHEVPLPTRTQPPAASHTPPGVPATKGTNTVINIARQALGTPYVWGGNTAGRFDCSGLLQYAYGKIGVKLDHGSISQFHTGQSVPNDQLRPGDAVFFEPGNFPQGYGPGHVGIYIGNNKLIEAPHTGANVRISQLFGKGGRAESLGYMGARRYA